MIWPIDFLNQIICGNCLNVLDEIPSDVVDIVFTSPPYNVGLQYDKYIDLIPELEYESFSKSWLKKTYRVAKESCRLYVVLSDKLIWKIRPIAENVGWNFIQILFWCKPNFAGAGKITLDWNPMSEPILLFRKGKRTPMLSSNITTTHNWFVETSPQTNFRKDHLEKVHPAQFPVNLVRRILARTPGDVVLDPFCGVGSTCIAAKGLGKSYVGIDLSRKYCQLSRERIG